MTEIQTRKRMVILILSSTFYPKLNGTTLAVAEHVRNLAKRGNHVYLVTKLLPSTSKSEKWEGIEVFRVGPAKATLASRVILSLNQFVVCARLIRTHRVDVIHANGFATLWTGLLLRAIYSTPVVATFHGLHRLWSNAARWRSPTELALTWSAEKYATSKVDRIVAQSEDLKATMAKLYGINEEKIAVVPHPVDVELFRFTPNVTNPPMVLFVGTLGRIHGPDLLVRSAAIVLREYPNVKFVIVGKGPMREPLESLTKELGIDSNVQLVGPINDRSELSKIYSSATMVVIPLRYKGYILSKVAVEAMACGRPVVTTMKLSEELREKGVTMTGDSPEEIAKGIFSILDLDKLTYEKVCQSARSYVEANCSDSAVTLAIENIYFNIVHK